MPDRSAGRRRVEGSRHRTGAWCPLEKATTGKNVRAVRSSQRRTSRLPGARYASQAAELTGLDQVNEDVPLVRREDDGVRVAPPIRTRVPSMTTSGQ